MFISDIDQSILCMTLSSSACYDSHSDNVGGLPQLAY